MNGRSIIVLFSIKTLNELVGLALCDLACQEAHVGTAERRCEVLADYSRTAIGTKSTKTTNASDGSFCLNS